jgi:ubiquinone/menaquinone biosynthesis C-methylase UbiE
MLRVVNTRTQFPIIAMGGIMQATNTADETAVRRRLHGMWASVAPAWGEYAEYADARGEALTERMFELVAPAPGERVLELACGAGGLGLAAAERVAPGGEVVLSDVVAEMTAIASARAEALGLANVSARPLDLEHIEEPDACYDIVLCREGLMFAVDPARATREIGRVLRPGGRFAIAVWGPREENPWLALVLDAASAHLGMPIPPPGMPGPFSLEDADRLAALLSDAGLEDVAIEEFPAPARAGSPDEWWTRTCALAGPLANILASLPEESARELRSRAQGAAERYQTADGLEFPGLTLVATGHAYDHALA